jgi:hypothetical protein
MAMSALVLDVNTGFERMLSQEDQQAYWAWLEREGLLHKQVYRLEIDLEHKTAAVFSFAQNEKGKLYRDLDSPDRVARREPYTVWLRELPPIYEALQERE